MHIITRVRSALRAINVFTLATLNPPNPSESPYTAQGGRAFSGTRVF